MEIHHDCWSEILKHIDDGTTYKSAIWTCKRFWEYFEPTHIEYVRKYTKSQDDWDWGYLSTNPNIAFDIIFNNS